MRVVPPQLADADDRGHRAAQWLRRRRSHSRARSSRPSSTTSVSTREQALQGIVSPGGLTTTSGYILMGLAADRHAADAATDALVRLIVTRQLPDGRWASAYRPPSESSEFTAAAVGLRGIQLYGTATPPQRRAVAAAAAWLAQRAAAVHRRSCLQTARAHLGGCSRTERSAVGDSGPSRFATHRRGLGAAACDVERCVCNRLCARRAARSRRSDQTTPCIAAACKFLLETRSLPDGSWFVPSRSHQTQIYFESGFPHGANQFISAAATNWATQALILSEQRRTSTTPAVIASRTPK